MIKRLKNGLKAAFLAISAGANILAAFIAGGVLFCSLIFILLLALVCEKIKKSPASLAGFFQMVFGDLLWLIFKYFCALKIKGRENIRHLKNGNRPVLFIANHNGLLDPMVLLLAVPMRLRPVSFLASTWVFLNKIMGKLAKATGGIQIPALVLKPEGMAEEEWKTKRRFVKMEEIIKILKENGVVGVFPQGEITNPSLGVRGNIKVGTAQLMLMPEMKNLIVVPVAVSGTWGLICHVHYGLTLSIQSIYDFIMRRRKLAANIGKPFALADIQCSAGEIDSQEVADFILKKRKEKKDENLEITGEEKKLTAMSFKIAGKVEELL